MQACMRRIHRGFTACAIVKRIFPDVGKTDGDDVNV